MNVEFKIVKYTGKWLREKGCDMFNSGPCEEQPREILSFECRMFHFDEF